jgi:hypothetical protein
MWRKGAWRLSFLKVSRRVMCTTTLPFLLTTYPQQRFSDASPLFLDKFEIIKPVLLGEFEEFVFFIDVSPVALATDGFKFHKGMVYQCPSSSGSELTL